MIKVEVTGVDNVAVIKSVAFELQQLNKSGVTVNSEPAQLIYKDDGTERTLSEIILNGSSIWDESQDVEMITSELIESGLGRDEAMAIAKLMDKLCIVLE